MRLAWLCNNYYYYFQEWTREYEVMKEKVKTKTKTEDKKSRMFEKVKNLARQCFLYFIDLVIE